MGPSAALFAIPYSIPCCDEPLEYFSIVRMGADRNTNGMSSALPLASDLSPSVPFTAFVRPPFELQWTSDISKHLGSVQGKLSTLCDVEVEMDLAAEDLEAIRCDAAMLRIVRSRFAVAEECLHRTSDKEGS